MINSGTYLYITCDVCGRDEEDLGADYQSLYASYGEAVEAWDGNDCGPRPAPDGKALCWDCADKAQAGGSDEDAVAHAREFLEGQVALVEYDNAQRTISGILRQLGEAMALLAELADEVDRLRALTTVDDAMVERAAREIELHAPSYRPINWPDDHRELARAALEAALGVEP